MTDSASSALKKLATGSEHRSKMGRLRSVYPDIVRAQHAGIRNSKIVETLNEQGFDLTLKTFETMLYRIRKAQAKQRPESVPATRPSPTAIPSHSAPQAISSQGSQRAQEATKPAAPGDFEYDLSKKEEALKDLW